MSDQAWQATNLARIAAQVEKLRSMADGPLFMETWSGHFVVVTKSENHLRLWLLDETSGNTQWVQSELRLDDPLYLSFGYTRAMLLALAWQPKPTRVLVTGLGGGCLPLVLHHHLPSAHFDCVEIALPVIRAATTFFPLPQEERFQIHTEDAKAFLAAQPAAHYDILFLDLFNDHGSTPPHLTDERFFELCHSRLTEDGVLTMNLFMGAPDHAERLARIQRIFTSFYLCPIHNDICVVFASRQPALTRFALIERAMAEQQHQAFRFRWAEWIQKIVWDREGLTK